MTSALVATFAALAREPRARAGLVILLVFCLIATIGPVLVVDPGALVGVPLDPPSREHWLGTTGQGQDVLAQLVVGATSSLGLALVVGLGGVAVGTVVGVTAGYLGGWVDAVLSLVANVFLVLPGLPLSIVLAAYLPSGRGTIAAVLVVTGWAWTARVLRAETLSLRRRDFVAASIVAGESTAGIIFRDVLPNLGSQIVTQAIGTTGYALGAEVGLEFLGLGDVSRATWGTNLYWASNDAALLTGSWWTFVPTGLSIACVGFALVMLSAGFDEVTNPRLGAERAFRAHVARAGVRATGSTPVVRGG